MRSKDLGKILRFAQRFEQRTACRRLRTAELLDAEQTLRIGRVYLRERVVRAHLRAVALQGGELAGHPAADVDDERWLTGEKPERVRHQAPEA